jgi:predicted DNA-binding protein
MLSAMTAQVPLRLPDELKARIDERRERVGLSRNAWIVKALEWAVEQPIRTIKTEERV